jgi:glucosamine--fructose-6-phosphate aminotransferase (isomerizing)
MCGIIGFSCSSKFEPVANIRPLLKELLLLSESRGKEASGLALGTDQGIRFIRTPFAASELVRSKVFEIEVQASIGGSSPSFSAIGHSRLVTNGYEHDNRNNQPVVVGSAIAVHNGIIVNYGDIWAAHPMLEAKTELDSEVIPALINSYATAGMPIGAWMPTLFAQVKGMTSIAMLLADRPAMLLATNNGSLYYVKHSEGNAWVFASERHILETALQRHPNLGFNTTDVLQLKAGHFMLINLNDQRSIMGSLSVAVEDIPNIPLHDHALPITEVTEKVSDRPVQQNRSMEYTFRPVAKSVEREVTLRLSHISLLKRCTRCILPETFPFITFDGNGVCNYCHNHVPLQPKGPRALAEVADRYRGKGTKGHDCLVPFSGGRDSSYALHYIKHELNLTPLAFSYDWGMLTDLGRRNQARMCGALGVEHILVSADIRKKRENIRKNVSAWLKRPHLGTIPLFMAGDKQYFYFTSLLMRQNELQLSVMGENMLETTRFKTGFCGIPPHFSNDRTYSIPLADKVRMMLFYGKEYLLNPAYINTSLLDTLDAFKSYYVMKHDNLNIFDYLPWDEQTIERTLLDGYDWEIDPGTRTTWRIGDGTAAFYNYIYLMVAGFTENDTFRSNQVREGMISREYALERATIDNIPRWDSIQWYCNVIGIDCERALGTINRITPLYHL